MPPNRAAMPSRPVAAGGSLARGSCLRCSCLPKQHRPLIIPNFERLFPAGGGCEIPRAGGEACPRWCGKSGRHHREPLAARTRPAHHPREPGWPGRAMRGLTPEGGERNEERPPGVSDPENATGVVVIGTEICGLSSCSSREPYRVGPSRGTDGSNPSPSGGESGTNSIIGSPQGPVASSHPIWQRDVRDDGPTKSPWCRAAMSPPCRPARKPRSALVPAVLTRRPPHGDRAFKSISQLCKSSRSAVTSGLPVSRHPEPIPQ